MTMREQKFRSLRTLLVTMDVFLTGNSVAEVREYHKEENTARSLVSGSLATLSDNHHSLRFSGCTHTLSLNWDATPRVEARWYTSEGFTFRTKIQDSLKFLY